MKPGNGIETFQYRQYFWRLPQLSNKLNPEAVFTSMEYSQNLTPELKPPLSLIRRGEGGEVSGCIAQRVKTAILRHNQNWTRCQINHAIGNAFGSTFFS